MGLHILLQETDQSARGIQRVSVSDAAEKPEDAISPATGVNKADLPRAKMKDGRARYVGLILVALHVQVRKFHSGRDDCEWPGRVKGCKRVSGGEPKHLATRVRTKRIDLFGAKVPRHKDALFVLSRAE